MTDAPDWQEVITGPGGSQPVVGSGASWPNPTAFGWGLWVNDPATSPGIAMSTGSNLSMSLAVAVETVAVSHILFHWINSTAVVTANENFWGVYTAEPGGVGQPACTLLAHTATGAVDPTIHTLASFVTLPLNTSINLTAGAAYFIALLMNITSGTQSMLGPAWGIAGPVNIIPPNNQFPFVSLATGTVTTIPASIQIDNSTYTMDVQGPWAALY